MEKSYGQSDPRLVDYVWNVFKPNPSWTQEVRARSEGAGMPQIHVGEMDALHLEVLTRAFASRKIVEIGTLAGLSGVALLKGAPADARLLTFEFEPLHARVARETFEKNGVSDRAEIFVGPALANLTQIEKQGPFDLVFIDADKVSYPQYIRWAAKHLRPGGVVLGDNSFGWGLVAGSKFNSAEDEATAKALRDFNEFASNSGEFRSTLLPTGEGLTLAVKL